MKKSTILKSAIVIIGFAMLVAWDIKQADSAFLGVYKSFRIDKTDAVSSATTKVSIVRSDDDELEHPTPITDKNITYQTIEDMTRRAIELAGGINWLINEGDMVLLKPNIVSNKPSGSGEVTDVRVIKALIKIIDDLYPGKVEIVVGEASPAMMNYEKEYAPGRAVKWKKLWDKAGYQDLLTDPVLDGINFRLSNLNCKVPDDSWHEGDGWPEEKAWADLVEVNITGGGEATPQGGKYWVHKDVINANVFITVPVMKIHTTGITAALKNQIGIAPGTKYGFWKELGVPQNDRNVKFLHGAQNPYSWTNKEIVDMATIAGVDYCVIDATACLETKKQAAGNNLVRMNMILAGTDPVAVDHVCTRLMGLNPDDIEHITLAERVGLGTNDPEKIIITGADLETNIKKFKKSHINDGEFGQSNRTWLLKGTYNIAGVNDPINHPFIDNEADVAPTAGKDGWSDPIYFTDNRIHLADYYNLSSGDEVVSYAFCYFDAPKDQDAELWIGNDEDIKIYVNGEVIYTHTGYQNFGDNELTTDKAFFDVKKGENRMLVKYLQKYSYYDFCLNICEPEPNELFDGNRIWGLKFKTKSSPVSAIQNQELAHIKAAYPNPFSQSTTIEYKLSSSENVEIAIFNLKGQKVNTLFTGKQSAGNYKVIWNGTNSTGAKMHNGVYFMNVNIGGDAETQKLILGTL